MKSMKNINNKLYNRTNLKLTEDSYGSILIMSVLIAGASMTCLLDAKLPEVLDKKNMHNFIPIVLIFFVFGINIWVSGNISSHISNIYNLLGGSGEYPSNAHSQLYASSIYHNRTRSYMDKVKDIGWISLPILIISIYWIIIMRYKFPNKFYIILSGVITLLIVSSFIYWKTTTNKILKDIKTDIFIRKKNITSEELDELDEGYDFLHMGGF